MRLISTYIIIVIVIIIIIIIIIIIKLGYCSFYVFVDH